MGIADDMKNLTQDIAKSYHARIRDIAVLKKETSALLKDFDAARKEMSSQLKDALAKGESQRLDDFKAMSAETKKAVAGIKKHTSKLLKDFDATRAEMSAQLKEALAKGEVQRLDDFKAMNAEIKKAVAGVKRHTGRLLKDFEAAHSEMSAQLKAKLSKDETDRVTQTRAEIRERVAEISKMLRDFQTERERMGAEWQKLEEMLLRERSKEVSPKKKKAIEREEPAESVKMVASPSVQ